MRTRNNPVSDYSEWLAARALNLTLGANSRVGFDAVDSSGVRYQIKGRRLSDANPSTQLSVFRNLVAKQFDFLIVLLFDKDFSLLKAYRIPHDVVSQYAKYSKHQNGHILRRIDRIASAEGVERLDDVVRRAEQFATLPAKSKLEAGYGAVKPKQMPEDLELLRRQAVEEAALKRWDKVRRASRKR